MHAISSASSALAFVEKHGVVLASARGPAPRLIEFIAGEAITGNWWSHPNANTIYNVLTQVASSDEVLVCRMVNGKITLVHRRLWPALIRVAERFSPKQISQVLERHTPSGRHQTQEVPFPDWVPADAAREACNLQESEALALISPWLAANAMHSRDDVA